MPTQERPRFDIYVEDGDGNDGAWLACCEYVLSREWQVRCADPKHEASYFKSKDKGFEEARRLALVIRLKGI